LHASPQVRTVAPFGNTLHVSANSSEALEAAVAPLRADGVTVTPIEPSLEDVFIALMQDASDNFGPDSGATAGEAAGGAATKAGR